MDHTLQYLEMLDAAFANNTFIKLSLSNYNGALEGLKNCYIKRVVLKNEDKLSFTYRYQTNDIVKNFTINEGLQTIKGLLGLQQFRISNLLTTQADAMLEYMPNGKTLLRKLKPSQTKLPSQAHNTPKQRLIKADGKLYLNRLKITDANGEVYKNAHDKYKQINHYIELLSPLLKNLPAYPVLQIADMGAGKGYLTFALYDYVTNELNLRADVTGVEYRNDLVTLCNDIAGQSGFSHLKFVQGSIEDVDASHTHVLIALHACDTATDDAIQKGITVGSDLIVVAPCCHKQIRREMEQYKMANPLDFLTKHGIFMERQAEMVTDGLRSLILEYHGYSTKVFQFVSDVHTPKNVMIVAEKKSKTPKQREAILSNIQEVKSFFGIKQHYLEKVLGM